MTLSPRDSRRHSWQPSIAVALPWSGVLGTSFGVMVLNWFSPSDVFRGGGKVTPITLPRPLTPRDSRGVSGMPSRQARTKWKIVGSSSRREKLTGLVQLEEEVGCAEQREFDDSSNYRGRSCTPWSGVRENRVHTMDDSRRPSKWQDDAVQAADTHCGLAARGHKTEKSGEGPRKERCERTSSSKRAVHARCSFQDSCGCHGS